MTCEYHYPAVEFVGFNMSVACRTALFLDVAAATALVIYVFRVLLGYKQTRDRYQVSCENSVSVIFCDSGKSMHLWANLLI